MTENQLFALVIAVIEAGLTARSITGVTVRRGYQPRITGTPSNPAIFFHLINPHLYGWTGKKDFVSDPPGATMTHTETQMYEWKIQCNALVPVLPAPAPLPTLWASDYVRIAAAILRSDVGLAQLRAGFPTASPPIAGGCGLERITGIRTPYFRDDSDQFELSPSFDFTMTFTQVDATTTPIITKTNAGILPV